MTTSRLRVGVLVFPEITQLDATAPCEIFSSLPGAELHLVAKDRTAVTTDWGLAFRPGGDMLVTERTGQLRVIRNGVLDRAPVAGVPACGRRVSRA